MLIFGGGGVGEAFNNFYWTTITGSWCKHRPKKVDHDTGRKSPASLRVSFLVKTSTQKAPLCFQCHLGWNGSCDVQSQHKSVLSRSSTVNLAGGSGSWISLGAVFAGFWVKLMDGWILEVSGGGSWFSCFPFTKKSTRLLICPPLIVCTHRSKSWWIEGLAVWFRARFLQPLINIWRFFLTEFDRKFFKWAGEDPTTKKRPQGTDFFLRGRRTSN